MTLLNKFIFFLFFVFVISCKDDYQSSIHISLENNWKFKTGDNVEYAKADFDDLGWDSIDVNHSWEEQGYHDYDGYAWYRIKLTIPSSIKKTSYPLDSIKFYLGKIDEFDQVYLNGSIIGQNTRSLPYNATPDSSLEKDTLSYSNVARKYVLAVTDKRIKWDQENVIAVRVFDPYDEGGLYTGVPYLGVLSLEDHLSIAKEKFYKLGSANDIQFDTSLIISNLSPNTIFNGKLSILVENIRTGKKVFDESFPVGLRSGDKISIPVSLPVTIDQLKIYYKYQDHRLKMQVNDTDTIPYVLMK